MENTKQIFLDNNYEEEDNGIMRVSYDFSSQEEAEEFADRVYQSIPEKINYELSTSDVSYETDEDAENEENGWLVMDISFDSNTLNTLEAKAAIDAVISSEKINLINKTVVLGRYQDDNRAYKSKITIDVKISSVDKDKISYVDGKSVISNPLVLSISGGIKAGNSDVEGGQIYDTIADVVDIMEFEPGFDKKSVLEIVQIWRDYHLNDLKAGTKLQTETINEAFEKSGKSYDYDLVDKILEHSKHGDIRVDNGYSYGSKWLLEELPKGLVFKLKALIEPDLDKKVEKSKPMSKQ
jgi:hypothetical protein